MGGGNNNKNRSRRVTQARSTGNASTAVAYSSRPVTRRVRPEWGKHCARHFFETESQIGLVTRRDRRRRRTYSTVALSQGAEACIHRPGTRARMMQQCFCVRFDLRDDTRNVFDENRCYVVLLFVLA